MDFQNRPLIAANWKMNGNSAFWQNLTKGVAEGVLAGALHKSADVVLCPPSVALSAVRTTLENANALEAVQMGGQNIYPAESGAFTGETAPQMLTDAGCRFVILGHSERRENLGETDAFVAQKTSAALDAGLTPIVCVGEGEDVQDAVAFLKQQLTASLEGISIAHANELIVAYEPIWAISTYSSNPRKATPEIIEDATKTLRQTLKTLFGHETGGGIRILYGGSMKGSNASEIMAVPDVAGGLIGGAGLEADAFLETIKNACV